MVIDPVKYTVSISYKCGTASGTLWHDGCNSNGRTELLSLGRKTKLLGEEEMKKTLVTMTLAATMLFGATFANAGIIIGDSPSAEPCKATSKEGIIIGNGIIIGDRANIGIIIGNIVSSLEGIIIGDSADTDCKEAPKDGIIIGNSPGIIIGN